ncbi:phage baseplate assembly protein [Halomonas sp. AOP22-C1-8]|uniref:phage baseplate assembly protein n=1 Tax=Halomonas sp. AOP22-C1-8 TaxID=3457717 RepID=UPI004034B320
MSELALIVDGTRHLGWKEIQIRRSLDAMADSFELVLSEKWAERDGSTAAPPRLRTGAPVVVEIDGEPVITGHIDDVLPSYDARSHSLVVSGRSKTADLVDSSSTAQPWSTGQTVLQVARRVAEPFGIEVIAEVDVGAPLRALEVEPGQTYGEALIQIASYRALLLVADEQGRLVITRPPRATLKTELALGENIRVARGRFSDRDRFGEVIVQGQGAADDTWYGAPASGASGRAKDDGIKRHRPTLVLCDTSTDSLSCSQRAEWEVRRRWGQSRGITYTVAGWRHQEGLWRPGDLVPIRDQWMFDEPVEWLITEVQLLLDERGERTEIRVAPRSSYDIEAESQPERESDIW